MKILGIFFTLLLVLAFGCFGPSPTPIPVLSPVQIPSHIPGGAYTTWWNSTWGMADTYYLSNPNSFNLTNYSMSITVSINRTYTDVNDFRMTWRNTTSGAEQEIGYWRQTDNWTNGTPNSVNASGKIWFLVPVVYPGTNNTNVRLYYNASGQSDHSNISQAFLHGGEFNGNSLDTNLWVQHTGCPSGSSSLTITGGKAYTYAQGSADYGCLLAITANATISQNATIVAKIYSMSPTALNYNGNAYHSAARLAWSVSDFSSGYATGQTANLNNSIGTELCRSSSPPAWCNTQKRSIAVTRSFILGDTTGDSYTNKSYSYLPEIWSLTEDGVRVVAYSTNMTSGDGSAVVATSNYTMPNSANKTYSLLVFDYSNAANSQTTAALWEYAYAKAWTANPPSLVFVSTNTTSTAANISCNYSIGISSIQFHPSFGTGNTSYLVYPANQSNPSGVLQCNNTGGAAGSINMSLNDTYPYVIEVASTDYFGTSNLVLNTSPQTITSISASGSVNISLYRNYTNKSGTVIKNVAVNWSGG